MTANVAAVNNPNRTYYYYELLLLYMVGISPLQANLVTDILSFLVAVQPQYKIVHSSSLIPKLMFIWPPYANNSPQCLEIYKYED